MASATTQVDEAFRAQRKREIRIAAPFRRGFGWRLVAEAIWGLAAWASVIALAMAGWLPYWLACGINGWIAYLMYMPLHEATHGNVHGTHRKPRWADDVVGHLSSIPLWFSFSAHRISHMQHHAHTNDPVADPDHFVAGPVQALPVKVAIIVLLQTLLPIVDLFPNGDRLLPPFLRELAVEARARRSPEERVHQNRFERGMLAVFLLLSLAGYLSEALLLWWLPSRIGLFLIALLFAWLPHHPHNERGRYRDTRVTLFPTSRLVLRGHDRHILHHMFPRVPHYRLPALFVQMRPILEDHDARIEGPLAGPGAPAVLLRWDESMRQERRSS